MKWVLNDRSVSIIFPGWVTKIRGGAEWQSYLISEELVSRGYQVTVINEKPGANGLTKKFINDKVKYIYYSRSKSELIQFIKALIIIYRQKSRYFYIRGSNLIFKAACATVCRITGRKMIYALAGDDELDTVKFRISDDMNAVARVYRFLDYGIVNLITHKCEYHSDLIITQTFYQQNMLKLRKGLESVVIRNSYINTLSAGLYSNKEDIILWVGNFRKVKQPEIFVEIARSFIRSNYRFVLVGNNKSYPTGDLPLNIELTGYLSYEDIQKYFRQAKILVNTSITEGFSNTYIEAWAHGVYVLSLNSNPDGFLDGKLGFCTNGDLHNIIKKIDEIINGETSIFEIVRARFEEICYEFDLEQNTAKLIKAMDLM